MGTLKHFFIMVAGFAFAGVTWLAWASTQPSQGPEPFRTAAWAESAILEKLNDPGCFRGGMALDLIERQLLSGKSADEVVTLLGLPTRQTPGQWAYSIGQCSGFGWHDSELALTFDDKARVVNAKFRRTAVGRPVAFPSRRSGIHSHVSAVS